MTRWTTWEPLFGQIETIDLAAILQRKFKFEVQL